MNQQPIPQETSLFPPHPAQTSFQQPITASMTQTNIDYRQPHTSILSLTPIMVGFASLFPILAILAQTPSLIFKFEPHSALLPELIAIIFLGYLIVELWSYLSLCCCCSRRLSFRTISLVLYSLLGTASLFVLAFLCEKKMTFDIPRPLVLYICMLCASISCVGVSITFHPIVSLFQYALKMYNTGMQFSYVVTGALCLVQFIDTDIIGQSYRYQTKTYWLICAGISCLSALSSIILSIMVYIPSLHKDVDLTEIIVSTRALNLSKRSTNQDGQNTEHPALPIITQLEHEIEALVQQSDEIHLPDLNRDGISPWFDPTYNLIKMFHHKDAVTDLSTLYDMQYELRPIQVELEQYQQDCTLQKKRELYDFAFNQPQWMDIQDVIAQRQLQQQQKQHQKQSTFHLSQPLQPTNNNPHTDGKRQRLSVLSVANPTQLQLQQQNSHASLLSNTHHQQRHSVTSTMVTMPTPMTEHARSHKRLSAFMTSPRQSSQFAQHSKRMSTTGSPMHSPILYAPTSPDQLNLYDSNPNPSFVPQVFSRPLSPSYMSASDQHSLTHHNPHQHRLSTLSNHQSLPRQPIQRDQSSSHIPHVPILVHPSTHSQIQFPSTKQPTTDMSSLQHLPSTNSDKLASFGAPPQRLAPPKPPLSVPSPGHSFSNEQNDASHPQQQQQQQQNPLPPPPVPPTIIPNHVSSHSLQLSPLHSQPSQTDPLASQMDIELVQPPSNQTYSNRSTASTSHYQQQQQQSHHPAMQHHQPFLPLLALPQPRPSRPESVYNPSQSQHSSPQTHITYITNPGSNINGFKRYSLIATGSGTPVVIAPPNNSLLPPISPYSLGAGDTMSQISFANEPAMSLAGPSIPPKPLTFQEQRLEYYNLFQQANRGMITMPQDYHELEQENCVTITRQFQNHYDDALFNSDNMFIIEYLKQQVDELEQDNIKHSNRRKSLAVIDESQDPKLIPSIPHSALISHPNDFQMKLKSNKLHNNSNHDPNHQLYKKVTKANVATIQQLHQQLDEFVYNPTPQLYLPKPKFEFLFHSWPQYNALSQLHKERIIQQQIQQQSSSLSGLFNPPSSLLFTKYVLYYFLHAITAICYLVILPSILPYLLFGLTPSNHGDHFYVYGLCVWLLIPPITRLVTAIFYKHLPSVDQRIIFIAFASSCIVIISILCILLIQSPVTIGFSYQLFGLFIVILIAIMGIIHTFIATSLFYRFHNIVYRSQLLTEAILSATPDQQENQPPLDEQTEDVMESFRTSAAAIQHVTFDEAKRQTMTDIDPLRLSQTSFNNDIELQPNISKELSQDGINTTGDENWTPQLISSNSSFFFTPLVQQQQKQRLYSTRHGTQPGLELQSLPQYESPQYNSSMTDPLANDPLNSSSLPPPSPQNEASVTPHFTGHHTAGHHTPSQPTPFISTPSLHENASTAKKFADKVFNSTNYVVDKMMTASQLQDEEYYSAQLQKQQKIRQLLIQKQMNKNNTLYNQQLTEAVRTKLSHNGMKKYDNSHQQDIDHTSYSGQGTSPMSLGHPTIITTTPTATDDAKNSKEKTKNSSLRQLNKHLLSKLHKDDQKSPQSISQLQLDSISAKSSLTAAQKLPDLIENHLPLNTSPGQLPRHTGSTTNNESAIGAENNATVSLQPPVTARRGSIFAPPKPLRPRKQHKKSCRHNNSSLQQTQQLSPQKPHDKRLKGLLHSSSALDPQFLQSYQNQNSKLPKISLDLINYDILRTSSSPHMLGFNNLNTPTAYSTPKANSNISNSLDPFLPTLRIIGDTPTNSYHCDPIFTQTLSGSGQLEEKGSTSIALSRRSSFRSRLRSNSVSLIRDESSDGTCGDQVDNIKTALSPHNYFQRSCSESLTSSPSAEADIDAIQQHKAEMRKLHNLQPFASHPSDNIITNHDDDDELGDVFQENQDTNQLSNIASLPHSHRDSSSSHRAQQISSSTSFNSGSQPILLITSIGPHSSHSKFNSNTNLLMNNSFNEQNLRPPPATTIISHFPDHFNLEDHSHPSLSIEGNGSHYSAHTKKSTNSSNHTRTTHNALSTMKKTFKQSLRNENVTQSASKPIRVHHPILSPQDTNHNPEQQFLSPQTFQRRLSIAQIDANGTLSIQQPSTHRLSSIGSGAGIAYQGPEPHKFSISDDESQTNDDDTQSERSKFSYTSASSCSCCEDKDQDDDIPNVTSPPSVHIPSLRRQSQHLISEDIDLHPPTELQYETTIAPQHAIIVHSSIFDPNTFSITVPDEQLFVAIPLPGSFAAANQSNLATSSISAIPTHSHSDHDYTNQPNLDYYSYLVSGDFSQAHGFQFVPQDQYPPAFTTPEVPHPISILPSEQPFSSAHSTAPPPIVDHYFQRTLSQLFFNPTTGQYLQMQPYANYLLDAHQNYEQFPDGEQVWYEDEHAIDIHSGHVDVDLQQNVQLNDVQQTTMKLANMHKVKEEKALPIDISIEFANAAVVERKLLNITRRTSSAGCIIGAAVTFVLFVVVQVLHDPIPLFLK